MCAAPERKREPVHDAFFAQFDELQNDLMNIQQILSTKESNQEGLDTIAKELESLKEDAAERTRKLHEIYNSNRNLFPKSCQQMLSQCQKLIDTVHPEQPSQTKWSFNNQWLNNFRKQLGY